MTLQALIFDVDGTLAETEDLHRVCFNRAFAEAGLDWAWDDRLYRELLAITGGKERMAHYHRAVLGRPPEALTHDAIADLHRSKTALYAHGVAEGQLALRPGIAGVIEAASVRGITLAIATTTTLANVEALLEATLGSSGHSLFQVIAAGDMVAAKKPAPDIYDLALQRLGLPAARCVAIEDSLNGFVSASRAGIATVVTLSRFSEGAEAFASALAVVPSLSALAAPDARSPPGDAILDTICGLIEPASV